MNLVFDSSAWFAYFNGSPEGEAVRALLEQADEVTTPASAVVEIAEAARRRKENPADFLTFLEGRSRIEPITSELALRAGRLLAALDHPRVRIRDALVLAVAQAREAKVVSLSPTMEGLEDIVPLG